MTKTITRYATLAAAGLIAASCSSASSGSGAQAGQSVRSAIATNSAVQDDIARAKAQVVNPCIDASTGPKTFISCVVAKVPKDKRSSVYKCEIKASLRDHVTTYDGRQKFLFTEPGAPAATPASATPAGSST